VTRVAREQRRAIGGMSARAAAWLAWSLCVLCVALAAASLILALLNGHTLGEIFTALGGGPSIVTLATLTVSFSVVGALIASHRPENPIGWIFLAVGFLYGLLTAGEEYAIYALHTNPGTLPLGAEASWLMQWIWAPGLGLILVFLPLLFPSGRPPSHRWRWVAWLGGLSIGLISVLASILLWPDRGPALVRPEGATEEGTSHALFVVVEFVAVPMMLLAGLGAVISLFVRFRQARGDERQQIKWFASAASMTLVWIFIFGEPVSAGGGLPEVIVALANLLVVPSIPVAVGIAILRHHLYDIDLLINRTLAYGALSVIVIGLYMLVVASLGALLRVPGSLFVSLLATGLVAVLFAPLRDRLQRAVNRLMYGQRDDPYKVLSSLGERLETTLAANDVLPTIVESVAQALKLPYAAITLKRSAEGEPVKVAEYGKKSVGKPLVVPLGYQQETVGELILSPRSPGESFSNSDVQLLGDLAHQVGVAAHAVRLTADLQRSRERLVTAREEERKRLRRDLHDGVGPQLATLTLKLETARNLLSHDPKTAALMAELSERARATVSDVRRSVHALRPPALDELGLVAALREGADQYSQNGLRVSVEASESLPPLPAAVEVAAYRIAQEAMTNVVRHAGASKCSMRITLDEEADVLHLEVEDDGRGLGEDHKAGVGTHSMRERAEELGGRCSIEALPLRGTLLSVHLPCWTARDTHRQEE
jgi:signal transduction histidine kinase